MTKETRALVRWAQANGWSFAYTRSGHLRLTRPGCGPVYIPSTPSCSRSVANSRAILRRAERSKAEHPAGRGPA